jgi:hypothetical protein
LAKLVSSRSGLPSHTPALPGLSDANYFFGAQFGLPQEGAIGFDTQERVVALDQVQEQLGEAICLFLQLLSGFACGNAYESSSIVV